MGDPVVPKLFGKVCTTAELGPAGSLPLTQWYPFGLFSIFLKSMALHATSRNSSRTLISRSGVHFDSLFHFHRPFSGRLKTGAKAQQVTLRIAVSM